MVEHTDSPAVVSLLGLTRIGLAIDLGGLQPSAVMEQIELVAEHVIPALT